MRDRLAAWRELLYLCRRKATRKRVHALRVITLRLQAESDRDLNDLPKPATRPRRFFASASRRRRFAAHLVPSANRRVDRQTARTAHIAERNNRLRPPLYA